MGDLNCNMASAHFETNTRLLCEISDTYGLQQLITEPTRITESSNVFFDLFSRILTLSTIIYLKRQELKTFLHHDNLQVSFLGS